MALLKFNGVGIRGLAAAVPRHIINNYEEALDIFLELKPILIEARGAEHPDILSVLRNESIALRALKRNDESMVVFKEVLELSQRMFGSDHPQIARSKADYGVALGVLERYSEAEENLLSAFEIYTEDVGPEHRKTKNAAKLLSDLYKKMGEPEKAAQYQETGGE